MDTKNLKKESDVDSMAHVSFAPPIIEIDALVYQKIYHWINKSNFEVSGLGKVVVDKENNVIRVIDAILLKQENTSTTTELDGHAIGKAMFELKDTPGELKWWWHSHVNMPVFWSGTDEAAMKTLGMGGWFASTVFNKNHENLSAFIQSDPVRLFVDDLKTRLVHVLSDELVEAWDKDYDDNVETKSYSMGSLGLGLPKSMQETIDALEAEEEGGPVTGYYFPYSGEEDEEDADADDTSADDLTGGEEEEDEEDGEGIEREAGEYGDDVQDVNEFLRQLGEEDRMDLLDRDFQEFEGAWDNEDGGTDELL